jgi:hypothetical protein
MALPADRERMLEEIAERHAERFKTWLKGVWEHGLAVYGKSKPIPRLEWYMSQTHKLDMQLALDPDYRARRKELLTALTAQTGAPDIEQRYIAGEFTEVIPWDTRPFHVEAAFQQYQEQAALMDQARVEAEKLKVQMPQVPPPTPPPMMWIQLMGMPGWFMADVSRDFRHLVDEQAKREGLVQAPTPQPAPPQLTTGGY